jgi:signal transduction histidine kinase
MTDDANALRRRLTREHKARLEAEAIAERVTAELYATVAKLEKTNRELEDANQSIREFVAVASHDLNSPLTSVLGFAQLLRNEAASIEESKREETLDIILRQGERMRRLLEDLLLVSQLDAGALVPHTEDVAIFEELRRCVDQLGDDGRDITLEADDRLVVRADRDHVQRMVGNYLTNALKYGEPPIVAEAMCENSFIDVCIRDHGRGVPADFAARLFSKFSRADEETVRSRTGTGLGLSIVRGLAEANGGTAWYEPNEPEGSCFGVRLPKAG